MNDILMKLRDWGCDIQGALPRFLDDEEFLMECIIQVSSDPAFEALGGFLDEKRIDDAFDAAHTLKGIIGNTGLTPLYSVIVRIVEPLRVGKADGLEQEYALLMSLREKLTRMLT